MNRGSLIPIIKERITLEQVCDALDVEYREGSQSCPFPDHADHNPSFMLKGEWFVCYACGRKGDAIDFVEGMRQCDTPAAVEWIAARFKLRLPGIATPEDLHNAIHGLTPTERTGPTKAERKRFVDEQEAAIRRIWKLYAERWGEWSFHELPWWEVEVEWRLGRVRDWALNRKGGWPGTALVREGYDRVCRYAVAGLAGPHRASKWAESMGAKPKPIRRETDEEYAERVAAMFHRAMVKAEGLGIDRADFVATWFPDLARWMRLKSTLDGLEGWVG